MNKEDRSDIVISENRRESIAVLKGQLRDLKDMAAAGKKNVVDAVNQARAVGDTVWSIIGHEKLLPREFDQFALDLPGVGIGFLKECLVVRRMLDEEISDYKKARPIYERLMVQLELIPTPSREGETRREHEPIEDFLASVIRIKNESARVLKEKPIDKWPTFYRETFLREVRPLHDLYVSALEYAK